MKKELRSQRVLLRKRIEATECCNLTTQMMLKSTGASKYIARCCVFFLVCNFDVLSFGVTVTKKLVRTLLKLPVEHKYATDAFVTCIEQTCFKNINVTSLHRVTPTATNVAN